MHFIAGRIGMRMAAAIRDAGPVAWSACQPEIGARPPGGLEIKNAIKSAQRTRQAKQSDWVCQRGATIRRDVIEPGGGFCQLHEGRGRQQSDAVVREFPSRGKAQ